jgi:hypothetical protein
MTEHKFLESDIALDRASAVDLPILSYQQGGAAVRVRDVDGKTKSVFQNRRGVARGIL